MRISYLIFLFLCQSVFTQIPKEVLQVLDLAGENRVELELLIGHYNKPQDSLKLKACYFLIENMGSKVSYSDRRYSQLQDYISSCELQASANAEKLKTKREELIGKLKTYDKVNLNSSSDIKIIEAELLIDNIDKAFEAWALPWSKQNVSFDVFCKYVLPYKINSEPFEVDWRGKVFHEYKPLIDSLVGTEASIYEVTEAFNRRLAKLFKAQSKANYSTTFAYSDLKAITTGSCFHASSYMIYVLRAVGIPASYDYVLFFGNRSTNHGWVAVNLTDSTILSFDPTFNFDVFEKRFKPEVNKFMPPAAPVKIIKVYRNVFEELEYADVAIRKQVLGLYRNVEDVTKYYCAVSGISILAKQDSDTNNKALLLAYQYGQWVPVCISSACNSGFYSFDNLGQGVVYLPAVIRNKGLTVIGDVFYCDSSGNKKNLKAADSLNERVTLTRKYPYSVRMKSYAERLKGGLFQASNDSGFKKFTTLYEIQDRPTPYYQEVAVDVKKKYQYYRYLAPDSTYGSIAEIEYYQPSDSQAIYGIPYGSEGYDAEHGVDKVFDKNKLSYYNSEDHYLLLFVGIDFEKPVRIDRIRYLPRNDLNTIEVGDTYELFYWDNTWISLGRKIADSQTLSYQAPKGALLWLRNLSGGKEERPFTYEDNMQVWW